MRFLEGSAFLALAGALHIAAFSLSDATGSQMAGGAGGRSEVTLRAAPGDLQELVAQWVKPPELPALPDQMQPAAASANPAPPALINPRPNPPGTLDVRTALLAPQSETMPLLDPRLPAQPRLAMPDIPTLSEPDTADLAPETVLQQTTPQPDQTVTRVALPAPALRTAPLDERPQIDTRLPAQPRLAPPEPPEMPVVEAPTDEADLEPVISPNRPAAPRPPQPFASPEAPKLPNVDVATATSPLAPATSRRPALRPDGLKPPPAPNPPKRVAQPSKKKPAAKARPAQRAAGSGGGAKAAKPAAKPKATVRKGPSKAQQNKLKAKWAAQVSRAAARAQRAPRGGASGTASVRFALSPSGRLQSVSISRSSGSSAVDKAALQAIRRARFPRAPGGLNQSSYSFSVSLRFSR